MLSLEEFKKSLGSTSKLHTEEEIERLRKMQDQFAGAFFDFWLTKFNRGFQEKKEKDRI